MTPSLDSSNLFFSLVIGIVPAIIWLLFWLREDKKRPEPRGLIIAAFVAGMASIPFVIALQWWTEIPSNRSLTFFLWASIEEIIKLTVAYFVVLRRKEDNEPIDPLIYMMTVALGFAAMENTIYISSKLAEMGSYTESLITGNIRFIGASLLHTLSSAVIGIAMGISFYKSAAAKRLIVLIGVIAAIALHTGFNLFIIKEHSTTTFATLGFVWIAIIVVMLFFEKIKRVYPVKQTKNNV